MRAAIRSRRLGPMPSTVCSSAVRFSITARTSAPNRSTSFFARTGPIPFTKPLPRYRSIPSGVVGGTVFIIAALNCSPCSLSLTHQPSATSHSPAVTEGNDPTTVVSSLCPCVLTRRTQKPLSSLWKVTRSIRPEISSVVDLCSGIAALILFEGYSPTDVPPWMSGRRVLWLWKLSPATSEDCLNGLDRFRCYRPTQNRHICLRQPLSRVLVRWCSLNVPERRIWGV